MASPEPYFAAMKGHYEAETGDLLKILCLPYGRLYDYDDEMSFKRLMGLCRAEGVNVPDRDDI